LSTHSNWISVEVLLLLSGDKLHLPPKSTRSFW
jgi:hypothetical protein